MVSHRARSLLLALLWCGVSSPAQVANAPEYPPPDARMKADILLVVAHPDDETAIGSYLAKAVFDQQRRIAIVYCNRGTGGGNTVGREQANAMGAIREIEARKAVAAFGITNVWFLNGRDTPGQNLFQSLQSWQHGAILEDVVRLVRLTRPEVIFTWLPHYVAGENHGDHQAAGVIATQAFDMAGDPTVFPAQVTAPRERGDINNATEGLLAWQPKKLYFFSDASHRVEGEGPAFDLNETSPSQNIPYYKLAARLHLPHLTQGDVSVAAIEALKSGDFGPFKEWLEKIHLLFGKAVMKCSPAGDVFDGVTSREERFVPPPGYTPEDREGVSLQLGGALSFYRQFWQSHGIERIGGLVSPEIEVASGSYLHVPLLISNATDDTVTVLLTSRLPDGWEEASGSGTYRIAPGTVYPAQTFLRCPATPTSRPVPIVWRAAAGGKTIGNVTMDVRLVEWSLPQ
jgi:LmbE family N-acetylglucosaminyl deacetylase